MTGLEVRFLCDDDHLFVGARMEEPNTDGLTTDAHGEIPLVWSDDDFELFLDPGLTQRHFWRFFQNAAGTRFTSRPLYTDDNLYPGEYESAVHVGEDHWSLEYRIPWTELVYSLEGGTFEAEPPSPGDAWGVNIWQHRQQSPEPLTQWSVMENFPYEPQRFGLLRFE
jgi:hypothetical protein